MPKPTCVQCSSNDSLLWRNQETGQICNECYLSNAAGKELKTEIKSEDDRREDEEAAPSPARATGRGARRSTRATRCRARAPPGPALAPSRPATRGRGRRSALKRPPLRAPAATATLVTSQSIFYKVLSLQLFSKHKSCLPITRSQPSPPCFALCLL